MKSLNYNDRLQHLKLESLELRRLKADLMMDYKIVHEVVDLKFDDFLKFSLSNTRSNGYKLLKPVFRTVAAQNHFNSRCVRIWNALPLDIGTCKPTTAFRHLTFSIFKSATCVFNLPTLFKNFHFLVCFLF